MDYTNYISIDPKVMMGKPVIKGTRITVELILQELSTGRPIDDLLAAYPHISHQDILAAFAFAADSLRGERVYRIGTIISDSDIEASAKLYDEAYETDEETQDWTKDALNDWPT